MNKFHIFTKRIHFIADIISWVSLGLLIALLVSPSAYLNYFLTLAFYTSVPFWCINSKLWFETKNNIISLIQWLIRLIVLAVAICFYALLYIDYCKDFPYAVSRHYSHIVAYSKELELVGRFSDSKQTFMVDDKMFWNVDKKLGVVVKGKKYDITYLPYTMYVIKIEPK